MSHPHPYRITGVPVVVQKGVVVAHRVEAELNVLRSNALARVGKLPR